MAIEQPSSRDMTLSGGLDVIMLTVDDEGTDVAASGDAMISVPMVAAAPSGRWPPGPR